LPWVALDHLVVALETSDSHLGDRVGLVEGCHQLSLGQRDYRVLTLVGRDDWGVGSKREMDSGERNQIGLELVQVDVQGTVESKRGSDGRHNLSNETIEVGEGGRGDAKVSSTDIVDAGRQSHRGLKASTTYASLSTMKEQSECSRVVWVVKTELYGSTTDVDILGAG
jgi:hypothetical protein